MRIKNLFCNFAFSNCLRTVRQLTLTRTITIVRAKVCTKQKTIEAMSKNMMIENMRHYFVTQPVTKAWMFGSFARGEEREDSDVDIIVALDRDAHVGLIKFSGMRCDLEELLQRNVDLVAEGSLMPFAVESANRDKQLIYERGE